MKTFIVEVIKYDKNKKEVELEEVVAASYSHDEHNNLIFYDQWQEFVVEYHAYNWISVRPKE